MRLLWLLALSTAALATPMILFGAGTPNNNPEAVNLRDRYQVVLQQTANELAAAINLGRQVIVSWEAAPVFRDGKRALSFMTTDCYGDTIQITFDEAQATFMMNYGEEVGASLVAHEIAHCVIKTAGTEPVSSHARELMCDTVGLDIHKQAGKPVSMYIKFFEGFQPTTRSDTHPSGLYRYQYIQNYVATGETAIVPYDSLVQKNLERNRMR